MTEEELVADIMGMLIPPELMTAQMCHVRIWQFALSAGMAPWEVQAVITSLTEEDESRDNTTLAEAITAYALFGSNARELNESDHYVGSVEFNTWRDKVEELKVHGIGPDEIASAVRHDFEVADGTADHTCSDNYVEELMNGGDDE